MFTRREFIKKTGLVSAGVLGCLSAADRSWAASSQQKNLLFIMTDQQRYDALSKAGNSVLQTPNLDRLANEGTWFKNAYTPCAVCGPARSSILTGYSVENTGVRTNGQTYYNDEEGLMTMPTFDEILTDNGYHCEYYGKWHVLSSHAEIYKNPVKTANNGNSIFGPGGQSHIWKDYLSENEPAPELQEGEFKGWGNYPYTPDPLDKYYGMTAADLEAQGLKHSQPDQHGKMRMNKENTTTAFQAKQTIEAIERLKDTTFSITCSFHFPHAPMLPTDPYYDAYPAEYMVAPESISDDMETSPYKSSNGRLNNPEYADPDKIKYMISNYYGLIKEIDDWVGKILDKLDELGLTENTMVIFTSDHGEMLGAHGMREKNIFYEESAHIPLLMRFPNEISPATTVDGYTSLVDLFPTILDYLQIGEHTSDGKSLRGLIEGTDQEHGKYVVTEWDHEKDNVPNYMIVKDGWKLFIPWKANSDVINVLYDLNTDPHEMNNLLEGRHDTGQYYEKVEELRGCLLEWLEKTNSTHYDGVRDRVLTDGPYVPKGEVLIARGSSWSYLDDGSDPGSTWYQADFDDSSWLSGSAELGFGDNDEATLLQSGHTTYYFRQSFNIEDLSKYKNPMFLDLLIDDGAVVYLNGVELARRNMPSGDITPETPAKSDIEGSSEYDFYSRLYSIDNLAAGTNVIAVEVHQSSADSPDLSFDLGLEVTPDESTTVQDDQQNLPQDFALFEPYPNPFNPSTTIRYHLPKAGMVKLDVYNALGRKLVKLVDKYQAAGSYHVEFNAVNLSSGLYFCRIRMGTFTDSKRLILMK